MRPVLVKLSDARGCCSLGCQNVSEGQRVADGGRSEPAAVETLEASRRGEV